MTSERDRVREITARALRRSARWESQLTRAGTHRFEARTVTKPSIDSVREATATRAASDEGCASGLFITPAVLATEPNTIVIERITGFVTLRDLLRESVVDALPFVERAGRALGHIHERMHTIHGDFNTMNVGIRVEDASVVILDWCRGRHLASEQSSTYELAHFLYSCVFHQLIPVLAMRHLDAIASSFFRGYRMTGTLTMTKQAEVHDTIVEVSSQLLLRFPRNSRPRAALYALQRITGHVALHVKRHSWRTA
jgi:tRNA A-37 threonylcarbamoyl transferase component Bud32